MVAPVLRRDKGRLPLAPTPPSSSRPSFLPIAPDKIPLDDSDQPGNIEVPASLRSDA
jgi:hypothetical protein